MNTGTPLQLVLSLLKGVKHCSKGWTALCPAHEDKQSSLSVRETQEGKVLIKCFAGCKTEAVLSKLGLRMFDLFPHRDSKRRSRRSLTVAELAADKKLPEQFLRELGVVDRVDTFDNPYVRITYKLLDGSMAPRQRIRKALKAKDGSLWSKGGSGKIVPYGLWRLNDLGTGWDLYLVEGESDCWSLWHHGFNALGLPGAEMGKLLEPAYLKDAARVYVLQEPDQGGAAFIEGVARRLQIIQFPGEVLVFNLGEVKDMNDLHKKNPEDFEKALRAATTTATKPVVKQAPAQNEEDDANCGAWRYFYKDQFLPNKLCLEIVSGRWFLSSPIDDAGKGVRLLTYDKGVFQSGESLARKLAHEKLEILSKPDRIQATIDLIKETCKIKEADLDPKAQELINVENGMLEWGTGKLYPHDFEYFSTFQIRAEYNPEAKSPIVDRFLAEVFPPDALPLAEEMLGYLLIPTTRHQKAFMLVGAGANGKSTFLIAVEELLGESNVSHVALQDMSENRFAAAELLGKLANIYPDLPAKALEQSDIFKAVVTGDLIKAERKFQHPFSLRAHARLLFSANELPPSRDLTAGFFRRWVVIPFFNVFEGSKADRGLAQKLTTPEARSALLNRAVAGLKRLEAQKGFTECPSVLAATEKYRKQCDNVYEFARERLTVAQGKTLSKAEAYSAYKDWCAEIGVPHPVSQKSYNKRLSELLGVHEGREFGGDGKKLRVWLGLGWAEDGDQDGPEKPGSDHLSPYAGELSLAGTADAGGEKSAQAGFPGPSRSEVLERKLPERISDWPEEQRELFNERAGTFEFQDGLSRQEAEARAEEILRSEWAAGGPAGR